MSRVAWLTCALLALAHARFYERCELARDLLALGVRPDHLATWVCIAYHESRFDTAANNPYSGDHGIFQISELYWCGPGKACGVSCAALRDDDISNDLECALQVHEEHTRLQGNGFLAWVVYPQHCKHNTKKYLVDCDNTVKNAAPITKPREFSYAERFSPRVNYSTHYVEDHLPSYLAIGNIFRAGYGKVLDYDNKSGVDWYNYKINNIDDLKLPQSVGKVTQTATEPTTTSTTTTTQTTTTVYIPPVKPWRVIETNQFRKKQLFDDKTEKSTTKQVTPKESITFTYGSTGRQTTTFQTPSTPTTTPRPLSTTTTQRARTTITYAPRITSTRASLPTSTLKPPTSQTLAVRQSTQTLRTSQQRTVKPVTTTTKFEYNFPRRASITTSSPFTSRWSQEKNIPSTVRLSTTASTAIWPSTSTVKTVSWNAINTHNATTVRPTSFRWTTKKLPTTTTTTTTTAKPTSTTIRRAYDVGFRSTTTRKPKDFSWYTFTSRTSTMTPKPKLQSAFQTTTFRPITYSTTTSKPQTTTQKPKPTQSIFDLYLNPTKPPVLRGYTFDSTENKFKLKIFASGTTTPAPWPKPTTQNHNDQPGSDNKIKRRILRSAHY